jgi:CheY-like chemotaxis protein
MVDDMEAWRPSVLVVDDEDRITGVIARILERDHEVSARASARVALDEILAGKRYDLMLCDLSMPDMDGVTFYQHLKRAAPELAERVVVVTGGAFTPRQAAFLEETGVSRLEKPFPAGELREVVRARLAQLGGASSRRP